MEDKRSNSRQPAGDKKEKKRSKRKSDEEDDMVVEDQADKRAADSSPESESKITKKSKTASPEDSPISRSIGKDISVQQMYASTDVPFLSELSLEALTEYGRSCHKYKQMTKMHVDRDLIPKNIACQIHVFWTNSKDSSKDWTDPTVVSDEELVSYLKKYYTKTNGGMSQCCISILLSDLRTNKIVIDLNDATILTARFAVIKELYDNCLKTAKEENDTTVPSQLNGESEKLISKELMNHLVMRRDSGWLFQQTAITTLKNKLEQDGKPSTFSEFFTKLFRLNFMIQTMFSEMSQFVIMGDNKSSFRETNKGSESSTGQEEIGKPAGGTNQQGANKQKSKDKKPGGVKSFSNAGKGKDGSNQEKITCQMCGWNHYRGDCRYAKADHRNKENCAFKDSTVGKNLLKNYGYDFLQASANPKYRGKCNVICGLHISNIHINPLPIITCTLTVQELNRPLRVLLDSGASASFISIDIANYLISNNVIFKIDRSKVAKTFSGFTEQYKVTTGLTDELLLKFRNEQDENCTMLVRCHVLDIPHDIIVGIGDLKKYHLIQHFPTLFLEGESLTSMLTGLVMTKRQRDTVSTDTVIATSFESDINSNKGKIHKVLADIHATHKDTFIPANTDRYWWGRELSLNALRLTNLNQKSNASRRSAYEQDNLGEVQEPSFEAIPSELLQDSKVEEKSEMNAPTIQGSTEFIDRLAKILETYKDCFSTVVRKTPAKLPPIELEVETKEWNTPSNRLPPRKTDVKRAEAINSMVTLLVLNDIIRPSDASHYSHGFVVPKPNGEWRLVVDFKNLNRLTTNAENWPIPNIKDTINRIGRQCPSHFGVIDLTSGYYQAPLHSNSRKLTAFMTASGLYEWLRLPMGLKGAGSYFQRVISTIVLSGLIGVTCELYLDDVIIFASSEEEFLTRLTEILERFRKFNITANPKKARLGLREVTYVGHTINEKGIHFEREKLDSVLNFPLPKVQKDLKSFLGLANWFRDHVRDHSTIVAPLQDMIQDYSKSKRLVWSEIGIGAFQQIKECIHTCPMLFFMDNVSPIYLHTDASQYGIGAYLYQVVDGKEIPIGFLSKSLDARLKHWDTSEKEGYAIFYSLQKWEYLLRDRRFILRTDHDNLLRLKERFGTADKVRRWFTWINSFDIQIEHIKGTENVVADTLSRLCIEIEGVDISLNNLEADTYVPKEHWATIGMYHNSLCGHRGVERTIEQLRAKNLDWKFQREHVKKFIKMCPCCQKMNQLKYCIHAHPFTTSTYGPMECIAIDSIVGLPADEYGNDTIIVIIDTFSRFVELYPMKGNNSRNVATALLQHIGRYGSFNLLTSDNGPEYANSLVDELLELTGIDHHFTMAYSKEENAIVERANKEVERYLRDIIFDRGLLDKWSIVTPLVQRIINSSTHWVTGVSPAKILFGNAIDLDRGIFLEHIPGTPTEKMSTWTSKMLDIQNKVMNIARTKLQEKDKIHMQTDSITWSEFQIGSYVLVEHRNTFRKGPKNKLLPYLKGPMRVINSRGSRYTLQDLITMRNKEYHVKRLRPFNIDPSTQDPLKYALRDDGLTYEVDKILQISSQSSKAKKDLKFKVKWIGLKEETWEPWSNLRRLQALQDFLINHRQDWVRNLRNKNIISEGEMTRDSDSDEDDSYDTDEE
jgi:hypothetical protein